ncbi:MAG: cadherin domain-containing protein [Flavobacteriales bacterium]|nr:cadherin domain-containing protein [Flavobacteriales bacterium]
MKIKHYFLLFIGFFSITLVGNAQAPNWSVNPNRFQYSMTITAVLDLNCTELTSPSNQLGAFVGDSLRGTAYTSTVIGGRYEASMTVYSDLVNGEKVTFRFYQSSSNTVFNSIDSAAFQDNAIYGSPSAPIVVRTNNKPTQITLSRDTLNENNAVNSIVGSLTTTDLDLSQTHTYTLVNGTGSTNNSLFSISGNNLIANFSADFENKSSYSIRLRTTDSNGCTLDKAFTIFIKDKNDAPTGISLSNAQIDENSFSNSVIGSLSAVDTDANETFTFSLVPGAGGSDNASFNLAGSNLRTSSKFNFETKSVYNIRVQVADRANNTYVDTFKITVNDINDAPTDVLLTADSIQENKPKNSVIATLATTDEDAGQTFAYSFSNVAGNDNDKFNIVGNSLRTKEVFDFEATNLYFIYIQTNDLNGGTYTKQLTIRVIDVNDAPTDIQLSTLSVNENMPVGTFVATIITTDQDANSSFVYSLVNGVGDADNSDFLIKNDSLFTNAVLNLNAQATHDIRIKTNDGLGTFAKAFTINVKDINDVPTDIALSNNIIPENKIQGTEVGTLSTTDADAGDIHTYMLVSGSGDADNSSFSISSNKLLSNTTFDVNNQNLYTIRVQTDDGFGGVYQEIFTISITNSNDAPTDISISNDSIYESLPPNTLIGHFTTTDPDSSDTHSYSFVNGTNDNASFAIVGKQLRSAASFNYEAKSNYFINVMTSDGNGGTYSKQFNINIKDTTDGPSDIAINNAIVPENSPVGTFIGVFTSTDEDVSDSFSYALVSGINSTDNNAFSVSNDSLFSAAIFNFEARKKYDIRIRSTDASGLYTEKAFRVNISNANDAPTDIALSNSNIGEDANINTTIGIFTTLDPDTGNTHSYMLVSGLGDSDNDDFSIVGNALKTDTLFDVNVRTAYSIRVRTTDAQGLSFEKTFAITITNANDAPTDIGLSPSNINENLPANTLVGNFTTVDADAGDNHIYTFANLSSNDNSSFVIVGNELRTSAVFDFETKSVYFIQVQTSDGNGGTYSRQLFVNVNDTNDIPTDLVLSANSVKEKQAIGEFIGKLNSVDQDATDTYNYTLVNGTGATDNSGFTIKNDSLFSNASFDVLVKSQLSIRIKTSDSRNKTFEKVFAIYVQNVNDAPIDMTIDNSSTPENTTINSTIGTFSTTDIDPAQTFTYQFATGAGDADNGNFIISGNKLKSNVLFDYNNKRKHNIRIKSTDQGGLFVEKTFTINIINSNDAPTNISLSANGFKENVPLSTTIGLFSTTDKDSSDVFSYSFDNQGTNDNSLFIISGNELKTSSTFDFETKNLYVILVKTTDNAGLSYTRQMSVLVLDSNDAPTNLSISADSVLERSAKGTFIADLSTTDEDATDNFTYSLVPGQGATDNALFRINGNLLEVDSVLNYNNAKTRKVRIQSTDKGGRTIQKSFVIRVINQNDLPSDIQLSDTSINEIAPIGTRVAILTTTDADLSDTFVYSLVNGSGDQGNAAFTISGNLLLSNANFDFETQNSFPIRLKTTDNQGGSFEKTFTIAIRNGNEKPSIENQFFAIEENSPAGTTIGTVIASDLDANETFTYRIVGSQLNLEIIAATGELKSLRSFDYENQRSYELKVEVTDLGGLKDTASVEIEILDLIEGTLPAAGYFSPNGDGINDNWKVQNVELYSDFNLKIFTASGEIVYEAASNYNNNWDGTLGGTQLPEGIYYYLFENTTNSSQVFKGVITLKR